MNKVIHLLFLLTVSITSIFSQSQTAGDSLIQNATLNECVQYALAHHPEIRQSVINEQIADKEIKSSLADWLPQMDFNFYAQHNYQLPVSIVRGQETHVGLINSSSAQFSVSQTIFNKDVLLASSTAGDIRSETEQSTEENKINVAVNVSKAYYAVLVIQNQVDLVNEDITRLKQSSDDSFVQYKAGVVDKTDYMQATIALNNARAELRQDQEQLKSGYANLKEQMGYPPEGEIVLDYDMVQMENDINVDTTENLDYQNRIEYKLLQTQKRLQKANLDYYVWNFLPSLSAYGGYNLNFQNDRLSELYNHNYPTSFVGIQLSVPIFQGGKRLQQIDKAELEINLLDYDQALLESRIDAEYTQALSNYKSNLNNYRIQQDNLKLAKEVYEIIQLQYKSGVKSYLDVITAETNLKSTQNNYLYALFQVLISKTDLQKAMGTLHY